LNLYMPKILLLNWIPAEAPAPLRRLVMYVRWAPTGDPVAFVAVVDSDSDGAYVGYRISIPKRCAILLANGPAVDPSSWTRPARKSWSRSYAVNWSWVIPRAIWATRSELSPGLLREMNRGCISPSGARLMTIRIVSGVKTPLGSGVVADRSASPDR